MCQLNLYLVPRKVTEKDIINAFQKYNLDISEMPYCEIEGLEERYKFYFSNRHCDCNSIISRLQNKHINSFDSYKITKKDEDISKILNEIF